MSDATEVTGSGEQAAVACADCGWTWPLPGLPPIDAECDNCGGNEWEADR